jgi:hypothetical protein
MKGVPEEVKDKLPKDFEDNWEIVSIGDIALNDYISYIPKPRKYASRDAETKQELMKGGYVTYLPDDDQKEIKGVKENVIGLRNYRSKWSISENNVYFFCRSKKDSKEILAKGTAKALKTKDDTRKRKAKILEDDIKEAQTLSKADAIKQALFEANEAKAAEEEKQAAAAPKKPRGRPKKVTQPPAE